MMTIRTAAVTAVLGLATSHAATLNVIRTTPQTPAGPHAEVTVTFDRPVAGGLEASIPAERIFSIQPAVPGRVEWRDPLTLRFVPASPYTPGQSYVVTIAPDFAAMDGSRLERAFRFSFHVSPPQVVDGSPAGTRGGATHLDSLPTFRILLSAALDARELADRGVIAMDHTCGSVTIPLVAGELRRISRDDPSWFRYSGLSGPRPDSVNDLRRVLELRPARALPRGCRGRLRLPVQLEPNAQLTDWSFATYGGLQVRQVVCGNNTVYCPTGPVRIRFSNPVSGREVLRRVRIEPATPFTVRDTAGVSTEWLLHATLRPRTSYRVVVGAALRDEFGQTLQAGATHAVATSGYMPSIAYDQGRMLVEREGLRTIAVQHVNVDTLIVSTVVVPDTFENQFLARRWGWGDVWARLAPRAMVRRIPVTAGLDARHITGVRLPPAAPRPGGTLLAVQISSTRLDSMSQRNRPITVVQVTDLGVHARIGTDQGVVWVTGVEDGLPRANVDVELRDQAGRLRARGRTDARGLAELTNFGPASEENVFADCEGGCYAFEGYVVATSRDDRALVGVSQYDPDLAPWRFGMWSAWGSDRHPIAATVFTERDIYRPGETVYAKAIVRRGTLGALRPPVGDSLKWTFRDREYGVMRDTVVRLSPFGTADARLPLPAGLPLGWYHAQISSVVDGKWTEVGSARFNVAEYRPPEFLVDAETESDAVFAGDSASFHLSARYLFGAPMAGARIDWSLRLTPKPAGVRIPGADGYTIGATGWDENVPGTRVVQQGVDSLNATGERALRMPIPASTDGRPATATLLATVVDANRQTVSAAASLTVHPSSFYIGARTTGERWFWTAGEPVTVEVIAVRPNGERVSGVHVSTTIVRREWHYVRRVRDGRVEHVSEMVFDTLPGCELQTAAEPVTCRFTPPSGGSYSVTFTARDGDRTALTRFSRWATGRDWVPWDDRTQLKMDVVADKQVYDVGDTATVFFASPFTDAEAWVTVERERVLESRRLRIESGATTLRFPITEELAPNAYVSIMVVRGRSAEPGPLDDPGRPAIRVGYTQLRVLPSVKRLAVEVAPRGRPAIAQGGPAAEPMVEYEPGDTARIGLRVRDSAGRGVRAEVTLWAVDEGVLALTGYQLPDPVAQIYAERGLGMYLASNLVSVAAQIPEGLKGNREPGGGGGAELAAILRSRFRTTAFFLGSVVTNAAGEAEATAELPDNLTTFRVMAVAVTAGDRYGSGQSSFLVSRPLVARPALPRFVREGDRFAAGVVVNRRTGGGEADVRVQASAEGIRLRGDRAKNARVPLARGVEVRFDFQATDGDSARFQFDATAGRDRDAVRLAVPVRPWYHPLAGTIAGSLLDTATIDLPLRDDTDASRSRVDVSFGSSVFAIIQGARQTMRVYPYYCTEQISSIALPVIALYRARNELGLEAEAAKMYADVETAVRTLTRRQSASGGIGYWNANNWTSPWLSAYAGRVLLEAGDAGVPVDSAVLANLADYLQRSLTAELWERTPVSWWHRDVAAKLSERVAAAEFLSRYGRANVAFENALLQQVRSMRWEDRALLAEMLARRGEMQAARDLLAQLWTGVQIEGNRAVLTDTTHQYHYFNSSTRATARLLGATLAVQPDHPMVGALVQTLVDRNREQHAYWNTQDYGQAILGLLAYENRIRQAGRMRFTLRGPRGALLETTIAASDAQALRDTSFSVEALVTRDAQGRPVARLTLATRSLDATTTVPTWFFATVHEVPRTRPVDPVDRGIVVERWYEDPTTKQPITSVREGELVRVRVRVTVPAERHFVVVDDPLPAGLEPVDVSLRTVAPQGGIFPGFDPEEAEVPDGYSWWFGSWEYGVWSPFDYREMRDDRVVWSASMLWPGSWGASYLARATTAGTFIVPPAHAEEMYNPGVNGRTGGVLFTVTRAQN